jgi:hypothetical protein
MQEELSVIATDIANERVAILTPILMHKQVKISSINTRNHNFVSEKRYKRMQISEKTLTINETFGLSNLLQEAND